MKDLESDATERGSSRVRLLTAIVTLLLILTGCNYLRTFPLYSELYVESPEFIELKYLDDPKWWDYPSLSAIRRRIDDYCTTYPDIPAEVAASLRRLTVRKGMNADQIAAVLGQPAKRQRLSPASELWTYDDRRIWGVRRWYYSWGKLRFDDGRLARVDVEYINIHK